MEAIEVKNLFRAYNQAMEDLLAAGVIRSANNPVGDYGEYLVLSQRD